MTRDPTTLCPIAAACLLAACPKPAEVAAPSGAGIAGAASPAPSIADPKFLADYAETYRFRLGNPTTVNVGPRGDVVFFLRSGPRSFVRDLYVLDVATGKERVLLTADKILSGADEKLTVEEKARRERKRMTARGIATFALSRDGQRLLVPLSGRLFVIDRASGGVKELESDAGYPIAPQLSPDGQKVTAVRDGDVYVIDIATGQEKRLTARPSETVEFGLAEFVAQEEMRRYLGTWWSPDSNTLVYQETDTAELETLHILDPMHPEREPARWRYPRAGKNNARVRLGIISVAGGDTTWIDWDRQRYPYLATVKWQDRAPLTIVVQNRHQTEALVLAVDVATGATTTLLTESDQAWLNIDQSVPHWLEDGSGFLWTTERRGAWQLELRAPGGELVRELTPVDFGYRGLDHVDEARGVAHVTASKEPTEQHLFRISLDQSGGPSGSQSAPERLSDERGLHFATFGKSHDVWVHTVAPFSGQTRSMVRKRDGTELGPLRSVAAKPAFEPRMEYLEVTSERFHAMIVRPRNFQPQRRYPVIDYVYGGPRQAVVQASQSLYLLHQWIADHGFIVVSIDGRGTPYRGRTWERAVKGNLIDLPLQDHVAGLKALGAKYPEMDMERVGVYGWSFGGYFTAMAVIRHGDLYRAGVAGAPVTDWRDYDTHYTERYMGLPAENPAGYDKASVLKYASQLERPLLLLHGTADDNVYFMHSIKLSDALFRAGRPHGFLPISGFTHMVPDPEVTTRLYSHIVEYFIAHL